MEYVTILRNLVSRLFLKVYLFPLSFWPKGWSQFNQPTTSSGSTFHLCVLTSPQRLNQIESFVVVGVTCHKVDQQCKTSAAIWRVSNLSIVLSLLKHLYGCKNILTLRVLWIRSNAMLPKFVSIPMINFCHKKVPVRQLYSHALHVDIH